MTYIYQTFLVHPLFNVLIFLYNNVFDFGLSIIILTILVRLLIYPLSKKSIETQKDLSLIQPKIKAIQDKFRDNREEQTKALLEFYKANKINPFNGFLLLLIQLPIFLALFSVLRSSFTPDNFNNLYFFINKPEVLNYLFLGMIDLAKPSLILAVLVGVTQFLQLKMVASLQPTNTDQKTKNEDFATELNKKMVYFFPPLVVLITMKLSGGLALYWVVSNLFSIFQQEILFNKK